jgi:hypothetical protein
MDGENTQINAIMAKTDIKAITASLTLGASHIFLPGWTDVTVQPLTSQLPRTSWASAHYICISWSRVIDHLQSSICENTIFNFGTRKSALLEVRKSTICSFWKSTNPQFFLMQQTYEQLCFPQTYREGSKAPYRLPGPFH